MTMPWRISHRFDQNARVIADRHYNRQKPGTDQFSPPAKLLALIADGPAVWTSTWPKAEFTQHEWAGAWINSLFRREGGPLASDLIRAAVAATRWHWPVVPDLGMVTFVNLDAVRPKRDPGYCYLQAGFRPVGHTRERGYLALQLLPVDMPEAAAPIGGTLDLLGAAS
jgi:hypothetical protein